MELNLTILGNLDALALRRRRGCGRTILTGAKNRKNAAQKDIGAGENLFARAALFSPLRILTLSRMRHTCKLGPPFLNQVLLSK